MRIGVLMGGASSEREISLKSGKAVCEALRSLGREAVGIDIQKPDKNYVSDLLRSYDIDVAFIALHGEFGEDGKLQAILEEMRIPYTGSGVKASALAMDKIASHKLFLGAGLNVPAYRVLENRKDAHLGNFPLVVKPATGGSSIGLSIVDTAKELRQALDLAFTYARRVIVEEYIKGKEITVGILEDSALEPIEIRPRSRLFDYKAKYEYGQTEYIVPAKLPVKTIALLKKTALAAHTGLGCSFFSRVDIMLDVDNRPFVLEVNTIPGFTATSLLPKAALQKGIAFPELVWRICRYALSSASGEPDSRAQAHQAHIIC